MKTVSYGLGLGVVLAFLITLENVIFPNYGSDSAPQMLISASLIGAYVVWAAYHASRPLGDARRALKVGAVTSLLGFSISMLTFIVIDNFFLSTVSKQADKVWGFQHSSFASMQAFINAGLFRGVLVGIPASIVFGIFCGWLAATIVPQIGRLRPD